MQVHSATLAVSLGAGAGVMPIHSFIHSLIHSIPCHSIPCFIHPTAHSQTGLMISLRRASNLTNHSIESTYHIGKEARVEPQRRGIERPDVKQIIDVRHHVAQEKNQNNTQRISKVEAVEEAEETKTKDNASQKRAPHPQTLVAGYILVTPN